jgi:hypothetical protein
MKIKSTLIAVLALACSMPAFAETKPKPLKVFIFAGQSNMTGMARTRTLEHLKMSPETAKEYADVFDKDGNPTTLDAVYVSQWMDKEGGRLEPKYGGGKGDWIRSRIWLRDLPAQGTQRAVSDHQDFAGRKIAQLPLPSAECRQVDTTSGPSRSDQAGKVETKAPALAVPGKLDFADDWKPEKPHALRRRHLGLDGFKGAEVGKVGDVYPIYMLSAIPWVNSKATPFRQATSSSRWTVRASARSPVDQWRDAFHGSKTLDGDWMMKITRWRAGKIETFDFDICDTLEGGRASLPQELEKMKQAAIEYEKQRGSFYRDMITT